MNEYSYFRGTSTDDIYRTMGGAVDLFTCFGWVRMSGPDCQLSDHPDLFEALPGEPIEVGEAA